MKHRAIVHSAHAATEATDLRVPRLRQVRAGDDIDGKAMHVAREDAGQGGVQGISLELRPLSAQKAAVSRRVLGADRARLLKPGTHACTHARMHARAHLRTHMGFLTINYKNCNQRSFCLIGLHNCIPSRSSVGPSVQPSCIHPPVHLFIHLSMYPPPTPSLPHHPPYLHEPLLYMPTSAGWFQPLAVPYRA